MAVSQVIISFNFMTRSGRNRFGKGKTTKRTKGGPGKSTLRVTHPQVYADETSLRPEVVPTMDEAKKFLPKSPRTSEDSEASSLKPLPEGPNRELMNLAGNSAVARRRAFRNRDVENLVYDERQTKRSESSSSTSISDIHFAKPPGSDTAPSPHIPYESSHRPSPANVSMFYMPTRDHDTRSARYSPSNCSTGQLTTASLPRQRSTFKRRMIIAWKSSTAVIRWVLRKGEWKQVRSSPHAVLVKASEKRKRVVRP